MVEDNAKTAIVMTEPEELNLKVEAYTVIGDADAIYNQGFQAGEEKGFEQGYTDGHADGYDKGFDAGEQKGVDAGKAEGLKEGYDKGYIEGYAEGLEQRKYEIWTFTLADGTTVHKEIALL